MVRDHDGLSQRKSDNFLRTKWRREVPLARRWVATLQPVIGQDEMLSGVAFACQPRAVRRPPTIECNRDGDLVRRRPILNGGRCQKVTQRAIEGHGGQDGDVRSSRGFDDTLEDSNTAGCSAATSR